MSCATCCQTPTTSVTPAASRLLQMPAARNGSPKWKRGGFIGGEPCRIGSLRWWSAVTTIAGQGRLSAA